MQEAAEGRDRLHRYVSRGRITAARSGGTRCGGLTRGGDARAQDLSATSSPPHALMQRPPEDGVRLSNGCGSERRTVLPTFTRSAHRTGRAARSLAERERTMAERRGDVAPDDPLVPSDCRGREIAPGEVEPLAL